jgi:hypothetical protein
VAAAREGNMGSADLAEPLLRSGNRPLSFNHSRFGMSPPGAVTNLPPPVTWASDRAPVRLSHSGQG